MFIFIYVILMREQIRYELIVFVSCTILSQLIIQIVSNDFDPILSKILACFLFLIDIAIACAASAQILFQRGILLFLLMHIFSFIISSSSLIPILTHSLYKILTLYFPLYISFSMTFFLYLLISYYDSSSSMGYFIFFSTLAASVAEVKYRDSLYSLHHMRYNVYVFILFASAFLDPQVIAAFLLTLSLSLRLFLSEHKYSYRDKLLWSFFHPSFYKIQNKTHHNYSYSNGKYDQYYSQDRAMFYVDKLSKHMGLLAVGVGLVKVGWSCTITSCVWSVLDIVYLHYFQEIDIERSIILNVGCIFISLAKEITMLLQTITHPIQSVEQYEILMRRLAVEIASYNHKAWSVGVGVGCVLVNGVAAVAIKYHQTLQKVQILEKMQIIQKLIVVARWGMEGIYIVVPLWLITSVYYYQLLDKVDIVFMVGVISLSVHILALKLQSERTRKNNKIK